MHATVHVFTFKAGLLARLAHDLRLTVEDFQISLQNGAVSARFRLDSLVVDGVVHGGAMNARELSDDDKRTIYEHLVSDVLETRAHPEAHWEGQVREDAQRGYIASGRFSLHGVEHALQVELHPSGEHQLVAELSFEPSRFGITPYKALGGAIRLQDRVTVRLTLDLDQQTPAARLASDAPQHWTPSTGDDSSPRPVA